MILMKLERITNQSRTLKHTSF